MEHKSGPTEANTKESGSMDRRAVRVAFGMLTVTNMRVSGRTIRRMAMDFTCTRTEPSTWAIGRMTCSMGTAKRPGLTGPALKASTSMGRKRVTALINGLMAANSQVGGARTKLMVTAFISGRTGASSKATGKTIICMGGARIVGQTVGCMKVNTLMTRSTEMEFTLGPMADSITDNGPTVSNMVRASIGMPMATVALVFGMKASARCGSTISDSHLLRNVQLAHNWIINFNI